MTMASTTYAMWIDAFQKSVFPRKMIKPTTIATRSVISSRGAPRSVITARPTSADVMPTVSASERYSRRRMR